MCASSDLQTEALQTVAAHYILSILSNALNTRSVQRGMAEEEEEAKEEGEDEEVCRRDTCSAWEG